jgi:hypothetical protein
MQDFGDTDSILKDYPWPASRLTKADMIRLTELRERLGRPITRLLHEAVGAYYRLLTVKPEMVDGCCESPELHWEGTRENAAIVCACGFVLCDDGQLIDWHDQEQIAWEQELLAEAGGTDDGGGEGGGVEAES